MEKRILALISLVLCLGLFLTPARAASTVDAVEPIAVSRTCTLAATYAHDGVGFPDVSVSLYKVAEVSADYQYTLTGGFRESGLQLNGVTSTREWNTIRSTLEACIAGNGIQPQAVRSTDGEGRVSFPELTPGMYLIAPVACEEDGFRYYFASVLTSLPDLGEEGIWNYDVTIQPKPDIDNPTGEDQEYRVLKLWKDGGNSEKRPTSVEIDILLDDETVRTVVLSEENNWCYSWYARKGSGTWRVVERNVPKGYKMTVEDRVTTFAVVNAIPDSGGGSDGPKTGDVFDPGLYIMLSCISGAVLLLLGSTGKRKTK